ncbi:sigma-70 family RNA polymerase sigma factor [Microbacteriaceae bacterium VKM Ac-2855]|nr:sigma-70 family RNA polymerase sigma factor [Microbacteriaceae bacterium VKM Ac-2855]
MHTSTAPVLTATTTLIDLPLSVPIEDESDRILVIRASAGDSRAFTTLVRRHTGLLRAVARRALGSSADVDDVVQETFLAAWHHADSVIDGTSIAGWLVTTARRKSYDRLRSAESRRRADLADDEILLSTHGLPDISAHHSSLASDTRRALESMPLRQRRCWELFEIDRLSYREIADALELSESTVRGLLARSRNSLRIALAHWR